MTLKKQMEKAIKGYLSSMGFKHNPKGYNYIRKYSDDIIQSIGYADETHCKPRYHFLRMFIGVGSISLDKLLYDVTDGLEGNSDFPVGPPYFCSYKDMDNPFDDTLYIHSEFIGDRPMEDNIADFDRMYKEYAQLIFDKYSCQKAIYTCPLTDVFFNNINAPSNWFYVPLAYFFNSEFTKAFEFIKERVTIVSGLIGRFGLNETNIQTLTTYSHYSNNLQRWIVNERTFKVDDDFLPLYESNDAASTEKLNAEIQEYIKKLLK